MSGFSLRRRAARHRRAHPRAQRASIRSGARFSADAKVPSRAIERAFFATHVPRDAGDVRRLGMRGRRRGLHSIRSTAPASISAAFTAQSVANMPWPTRAREKAVDIRDYNRRFAFCFQSWFDCIYRDKYYYIGDAETDGCGAAHGCRNVPPRPREAGVFRSRYACSARSRSTASAGRVAAKFIAFYNRRLVAIARKRDRRRHLRRAQCKMAAAHPRFHARAEAERAPALQRNPPLAVDGNQVAVAAQKAVAACRGGGGKIGRRRNRTRGYKVVPGFSAARTVCQDCARECRIRPQTASVRHCTLKRGTTLPRRRLPRPRPSPFPSPRPSFFLRS